MEIIKMKKNPANCIKKTMMSSQPHFPLHSDFELFLKPRLHVMYCQYGAFDFLLNIIKQKPGNIMHECNRAMSVEFYQTSRIYFKVRSLNCQMRQIDY